MTTPAAPLAPPDARSPLLPIDELAERFPDEWIAVRVTGMDERRLVSHGQLLAHSRSEKKAWGALVRAYRENPDAKFHIFIGGTEPRTTEEWRERLSEAAGKIKDYRDAWW